MRIIFLFALLSVLLAACAGAPTPTAAPTPTVPPQPTIASATGYRPIQTGDEVEGATISYQYVLPSLDEPVITIALANNLLQLVQVNPNLTNDLTAFARELAKQPAPVLGYDEATPNQTEPKAITWDGTKPIEVVFIPIVASPRFWSVTETDEKGVQAAYKIVRRKDGGLRFIDAYGQIALFSANNMITLNGGGTGLMFSSRLALLKLILTNEKYQRGANVFADSPIDHTAYDPRILKLDPSRTGLAQDRDWVLISRPGPNPGLQGP